MADLQKMNEIVNGQNFREGQNFQVCGSNLQWQTDRIEASATLNTKLKYEY